MTLTTKSMRSRRVPEKHLAPGRTREGGVAGRPRRRRHAGDAGHSRHSCTDRACMVTHIARIMCRCCCLTLTSAYAATHIAVAEGTELSSALPLAPARPLLRRSVPYMMQARRQNGIKN